MKKMIEVQKEVAKNIDPSVFPKPSPCLYDESSDDYSSSDFLPSLPSATQSKAVYAYLGPSNGYVRLYSFAANRPASYDWVGLYKYELVFSQ